MEVGSMANAVALITGASSGIGAEFARQLAADKMDLVLVARRADRLAELRAEIEQRAGVRCHVIAKDLGGGEAPAEVFRETERLGLAVDWVVHNAGFGTNREFVSFPPRRQGEEMPVNMRGPG